MQNRSRILSIFIILFILSIGLMGCGKQSTNTTSNEAKGNAAKDDGDMIVVGGSYSLSGPAGVYGQGQRNAAQLVIDQINKKGGINGKKVKFITYDDESTPDKGVENTTRLIEKDKVVALFGYGATPVIAASAPIAQQAGVPMTVNGGGYQVKPEETFIFNTFHTMIDATKGILKNLQQIGIKRLALIQPSDPLGQVGVDAFTKLAPDYGIKIVAVERFKNTDTDISAQMTNIKQAKPEAIQTNATGTPSALVAKTAVQIGLDVPIALAHGSGIFAMLDLMKGVPDHRVIIPSGPSLVWEEIADEQPSKKVMSKYAPLYKKAFGSQPDYLAAGGLDAALQTMEAIEKAGPDKEKIRDYLANLKNWSGAQGNYVRTSENHHGLNGEEMIFVTIEKGKYVLFNKSQLK
jgi:branched-chain amino acid transport system substrate-binding protein